MSMHGERFTTKDEAFAEGVRTGLRHADAEAVADATGENGLDYRDLSMDDVRAMSVEEINDNWDAVQTFLAGGES